MWGRYPGSMAQDGLGWGRTAPGLISLPPGYEGKQVWPLWFLREGTQLGRAIEIAVAGKHAGPLTSLSRKQREGSQCSSSPSLCPTAIPHQNVLRGGTVAKFWIFSRSQRRGGVTQGSSMTLPG